MVTAEGTGGRSAPTLCAEDVLVKEGQQPRPVRDLLALEKGQAQILLLIDDSAEGSFDTQIPSLKNFVNSLPANTEIAVGYMRNGMTQMASAFTTDHRKAAASIRLAVGPGGADVSPYDSVSDAVKKWPKTDSSTRREVIMISGGLEGLGGGFIVDNPYVNKGIADAQQAGVIVYAIYNPSSGRAGHTLWRSTWGQNFLSQLTDGTGGELYTSGFGSSVSFDSYLKDILERQNQQYVLTFEARPEKKSGLQPVSVSFKEKGTGSIAAPSKVFVKASL